MKDSLYPFVLLITTSVLPVLGVAACAETEPLPETPPRQISESPFHFPEELWDQGIEGSTLLKVWVSPVGRVDSVTVEETSGHAAFDSAAVQGAHRLEFEPARRGEEPVGVWVRLPVQFNIANASSDLQDRP
jgi:periplasmic protein TonB